MNIKVKAKITVDEETAAMCLHLVEMYLNENGHIDLVIDNLPNGELDMRFIERGQRNGGA